MTFPAITRKYIASTPFPREPHVTAQWEGDLLTSISVDRLDGQPLSIEDMVAAWSAATAMKSRREETA